jgi:hypothetical protein
MSLAFPRMRNLVHRRRTRTVPPPDAAAVRLMSPKLRGDLLQLYGQRRASVSWQNASGRFFAPKQQQRQRRRQQQQ